VVVQSSAFSAEHCLQRVDAFMQSALTKLEALGKVGRPRVAAAGAAARGGGGARWHGL
jgi:hypothetical protein